MDWTSLRPRTPWTLAGAELATFGLVAPLPFAIGVSGLLFALAVTFDDTAQPVGAIAAQFPGIFGLIFALGLGPALLAGVAFVLLRRRGSATAVALGVPSAVAFAATVLGSEMLDRLQFLGEWAQTASAPSMVAMAGSALATGAVGAGALATALFGNMAALEE